MAFEGFKTYSYPVYTVVCPQSGFTFEMRTMTVKEFTMLKSSLATSNRIAMIVNDSLWNTIVKKPEVIKTYDDFLQMTTLKDREALCYGSYIITFGEEKFYSPFCQYCEAQVNLKVNLTEGFSINNYPYSIANIASYRVSNSIKNEKNPEMDKIVKEIDEYYAQLEHTSEDEDDTEILTVDDYLKNSDHEAAKLILDGMPEEVARGDFPDFMEELDKFKEELSKRELKITSSNDDDDKKSSSKSKKKSSKKSSKKNKKPDINTAIPYDKIIQNDNFILNKEIKLVAPESNIILYLKQPTLVDEINLLENMSLNTDDEIKNALESLCIARVEECDEKGEVVSSWDDKFDICAAYRSLPAMDLRKIAEVVYDNFGKYEIDIEQKWKCSRCKEESAFNIDIMSQFFRTVREL